VLVDGRDVREYRLADLRRQVSLVSQDVKLFDDTIRSNIAYGAMREATPQEIEQAARAAHVLEFTERFPDGLDTEVGDRGVTLSGGQRQRVAIARALLKDTPILILDEATSALDTESERHIQAALEALMQNRTTLVIAHRLSTIEKADRIVVMDHGRIVEPDAPRAAGAPTAFVRRAAQDAVPAHVNALANRLAAGLVRRCAAARLGAGHRAPVPRGREAAPRRLPARLAASGIPGGRSSWSAT
jgi:ABC-type bacteriocin/lantibiotic exporter with double-glycine peptidase domain